MAPSVCAAQADPAADAAQADPGADHVGVTESAVGPWIPFNVGTFGGWTFANDVNDSGQVVGESVTATGQEHAFSWMRATGLVDLGTLGGSASVALAVNNNGQVVGWSETAGDVATHAYLWSTQTGMVDLGTLGGTESVAYGLNDSGQVVGASDTATGQSHAFSWTPTSGMIDLQGSDNRRYSSALKVNAHGQAIGFSYGIYPANEDERAFSWTPASGMIGLIDRNAISQPATLNDDGQVVGWTYAPPVGGHYHAFSWTASSGPSDLAPFDLTDSYANDVNARGQVVGAAYSSTSPARAFLWTPDGGFSDLGLGTDAVARSINDDGQVVGGSGTSAFSWTRAQGLVELGLLGQRSTGALKVNARGEIVGASLKTQPALVYQAVFWEPVAILGCHKTLAGCNLKGAGLAGAYLADADLSGANLKAANFSRANLSGANLTNANLMDVNFRDATLVGAQVGDANIRGVNWSNTACPDGTNSDSNGGTCLGHF